MQMHDYAWKVHRREDGSRVVMLVQKKSEKGEESRDRRNDNEE